MPRWMIPSGLTDNRSSAASFPMTMSSIHPSMENVDFPVLQRGLKDLVMRMPPGLSCRRVLGSLELSPLLHRIDQLSVHTKQGN